MRYQEIIDKVYANYLDKTQLSSDPIWLEPVQCMNMKSGEIVMGARQYTKNDFINKIKTDHKFSKRWELKIEERELSEEERINIIQPYGMDALKIDARNQWMKDNNVPTKMITLIYENEVIGFYE